MKKVLVLVCLFALSAMVVLAEESPAGAEKVKTGCPSKGNMRMERGEAVQLGDIPAVVKEAAEKSVSGIVLTEAKVMKKDEKSVYKVIGKANDKEYVVIVGSDGKVIKSMEKEKGEHKGKWNKEGGDKKCGAKDAKDAKDSKEAKE